MVKESLFTGKRGISRRRSWRISYRATGLDTKTLHDLKGKIMQLNTGDGSILSAHYADACLFQIDTSQMREPVCSCITCVPGSKEELARKYGYNKEICMDAAACAMNYTLQHGMKPVMLKAMALCGDYDREQQYAVKQEMLAASAGSPVHL